MHQVQMRTVSVKTPPSGIRKADTLGGEWQGYHQGCSWPGCSLIEDRAGAETLSSEGVSGWYPASLKIS